MLCRELELREMGLEQLCKVLCYPSNGLECCAERLEELKSIGVDRVYSFGAVALGRGVAVVGKGHAAVVVLAHHVSHGVVAIKVRRVDSKRLSMEWEARMLETVAGTGYAPRPYGFSENLLVREYVDGCTLEELALVYGFDRIALLNAVESLLKAALAVDLAGVDLVEISRPHSQVVYLCCNPLKPFFVDLESAKLTSRPLSFTKVVGFIVSGYIGTTSVRKAVGLDAISVQRLLSIAKSYKTAQDPAERRRVAGEAVEVLESLLR